MAMIGSARPAVAAAGKRAWRRQALIDVAVWGGAVLVFFIAPKFLSLAATVVTMAIFALSLHLALGEGGIDSLGHAAFFGTGAYAAGLYALHVSPEPLSGLLVAAAAAAAVGLVSGAVILRTRGLTLLMMTLAIASMLHELAGTARSVTGGDDGLTGYRIQPLLGVFPFDMKGQTAYLYGLAVLFLVFLACRVVTASPFGLTIRGIRENPLRMRLLGVPVLRRLVAVYTLSAAVAGVAGGLSAQVTGLVGVDTLTFALSGNVLIMLVLGGARHPYGAILGAAVFVAFSDRAAAIDPVHWLFGLGALMILTVRFAPDGLVGVFERVSSRIGMRGRQP